jgi:hypothetical protein
VIDAWRVRHADAQLFSFGEIYLVETNTVLTDHLCAWRGGFKNLSVKVILSAEERIETVTITDIREELILIERPTSLHHFPSSILETLDVITRGIDEARRGDEN